MLCLVILVVNLEKYIIWKFDESKEPFYGIIKQCQDMFFTWIAYVQGVLFSLTPIQKNIEVFFIYCAKFESFLIKLHNSNHTKLFRVVLVWGYQSPVGARKRHLETQNLVYLSIEHSQHWNKTDIVQIMKGIECDMAKTNTK